MDRCTDAIGIEDLRDRLLATPRFERDTVHKMVSRLHTSRSELKRFIQFDSDHYTRTLFHRDSRFEILVLAWRPGQHSPIHDHARSICTMYILDGVCESTTYRRRGEPVQRGLVQEATIHLTGGSTITVYGGDIHKVGCPENAIEELVTIHFYLPPIQEMLVFDPATGDAQVATAVTLDPLPESATI
jgi:predicted metal-dependent enzyme (double-stranded beta helix superfamily)